MIRQWLKETRHMRRGQEGIMPNEMKTRRIQAKKGKRVKETTTEGKNLRLKLGVELTRQEEEI